MKKIVRILASLVMGLMCVNCASARSGNEEKVSETRSVNPFHSIEVESVASVYFTQSDTYSLRVEGEKFTSVHPICRKWLLKVSVHSIASPV